MLNHGRDERTVGYADACNQSSPRRVPIDKCLRWRRFIIHRSLLCFMLLSP
jgi:hypothetical protein